jgi:ribosome-binding factor A
LAFIVRHPPPAICHLLSVICHMPTRRQQRVAHRMREEIANLIDRRAEDPRLHGLTVTGVEVSPDLRQALVYVSALVGAEGSREALAGLEHAKGFFRHELAARLDLRVVPNLIFRWDTSLETGERISRILDELAQSDDDT